MPRPTNSGTIGNGFHYTKKACRNNFSVAVASSRRQIERRLEATGTKLVSNFCTLSKETTHQLAYEFLCRL